QGRSWCFSRVQVEGNALEGARRQTGGMDREIRIATRPRSRDDGAAQYLENTMDHENEKTMAQDLKEAADRVDTLLSEARDLAKERLELASDDAVMQIFDRLCLEYDAIKDRRLFGLESASPRAV